jgi:glycerol-3-phosphate dehydrogenase
MAVSLSDVVFRRTDMATGVYPGRVSLDECARIMADELGWSQRAVHDQIDQVLSRFSPRVVGAVDAIASSQPAG